MSGITDGPLQGVRIVEFKGIGPGPFASMVLSDMGADVVCIARRGKWVADERLFVHRNRRVVELDLKNPRERDSAWALVERADIVTEGFRPGVMERLGLGPNEALQRCPQLVYGRVTGWGQHGPLAARAGHDINFISVAGALDTFRASNGEPVPPVNLAGDYAGGAMFLVAGVLAALVHARATGRGQVVDAAMVDGAACLLTMLHSMKATGRATGEIGTNQLDGGAHFYHTYACKDGRHIAVGASEPEFFAIVRERAGLQSPAFDEHMDRRRWPELKAEMARVFARRTSAEWLELFEGTDACVTAVVPLHEAPRHPHLAARATFVEHDGFVQPAPAPRFSATPSRIRQSAKVLPRPAEEIVAAWDEESR